MTWNIQKLLVWTCSFFEEKKVASPRYDAEVLLGFVLDYPRVKLYTNYDEPVDAEALQAFKVLIKRRANDEPLAYILNETEFYGHALYIDNNVLIPRPETELLIDAVLNQFKTTCREGKFIVELGTGSGNIAIALAHACPDKEIITVEKSSGACEIARRNVKEHQLEERIHVVHDDFFDWWQQQADSVIDEICAFVSNPPYIAEAERASLTSSVTDFEPHSALFDGGDGYLFYRRLSDALQVLMPQTVIVLETGYQQCQRVQRLFCDQHGFDATAIIHDYHDIPRICSLRRVLSKQQQSLTVDDHVC